MTPLLLSAALLLPQVSAPPVHSLVTLDQGDVVREGLSLGRLLELDFDVVHVRGEDGLLEVVCDAGELQRLAAMDVRYTVVHEDLSAFYAERARTDPGYDGPLDLGAWLSPPFGSGSMASFYTLDEVNSVLDQVHGTYPSITTERFSVGTTIEGRSIWALKVSDNPALDENEPEVRFDAMHHAREPESMQATLWMLLYLVENYGTDPLATYLVDEREIWFLPVVNPDGYRYNQTTNPGGGGLWRKNRRNNGSGLFGVDLNRNYSFQWGFDNSGSSPTPSSETYRGTGPASEPEIVAMEAFIDSRDFETALSVHTYSNLWLYPWGYTTALPANEAEYAEISALATALNSYVVGPAAATLYPVNGDTVDYDHGVHGTHSWTPEIGSDSDGFWPSPSRIVPLAEENLPGFVTTALAAGADVRVSQLVLNDLGDGDGNLEAGETIEVVLDLRNSGRQTSDPVTVGISSPSADVTVTVPAASAGSLSAFSSGGNGASPLEIQIAGGAADGTPVTLVTTVTHQGYTQSTSRRYVIGDPKRLVADDCEVDLGWTAGLPSDTASTGLWEYGDPVGTSYNGQPSNPEDDATGSPGVNCFATGNGSTSSGGDDVDDGITTLLSPKLDLSGVGQALVSYERWYANLSSPDDVFQVSITDDGTTWVPLEDVAQTQNSWTKASFLVSDYVSLTSNVQLRFIAEDDPNNSLVEAGIDELAVEIYDATPSFNMYGSPEIGTPLAMNVTGQPGEIYAINGSRGTGMVTKPKWVGAMLLDPGTLFRLNGGVIPSSGLRQVVRTIPSEPVLVGQTFYVQAVTVGDEIRFSNRAQVTFE